eukprot:SAG11_NODE_1895_length_4093_cov_4.148473_4_plen_297_part_00
MVAISRSMDSRIDTAAGKQEAMAKEGLVEMVAVVPHADDERAKAVEAEAIERLKESVCAGAGNFLAMLGLCCVLTLILPLALVYGIEGPEAEQPDDELSGLHIGAIISASVGLCFCLWGLAPALLPPPKPPAEHGPFAQPFPEDVRLDVKRLHVVANPKSGTFSRATLDGRVMPALKVRLDRVRLSANHEPAYHPSDFIWKVAGELTGGVFHHFTSKALSRRSSVDTSGGAPNRGAPRPPESRRWCTRRGMRGTRGTSRVPCRSKASTASWSSAVPPYSPVLIQPRAYSPVLTAIC